MTTRAKSDCLGGGEPIYIDGRVMTLTYDVTRCVAISNDPVALCPERNTCARFTMRGENVSLLYSRIDFWACKTKKFEQKIEVNR